MEKAKDILYYKSVTKRKEEDLRNKLLYELGNNLSQGQILYSTLSQLLILKRKIEKNKSPKEVQQEINIFFQKHANNVGFKQTIKDLQLGLNILNKNRKNSPVKEKNILVEDGILGEKTNATFKDSSKNYSSNIIKKYILKGIVNNIIFDTKNNENINTQKLIEKITKELEQDL